MSMYFEHILEVHKLFSDHSINCYLSSLFLYLAIFHIYSVYTLNLMVCTHVGHMLLSTCLEVKKFYWDLVWVLSYSLRKLDLLMCTFGPYFFFINLPLLMISLSKLFFFFPIFLSCMVSKLECVHAKFYYVYFWSLHVCEQI